MKMKLPTTVWGHAMLHVEALIRLRPTNYNKYSLSQLVFDHESNIAHLRIFDCVIYVSIAPPQRINKG